MNAPERSGGRSGRVIRTRPKLLPHNPRRVNPNSWHGHFSLRLVLDDSFSYCLFEVHICKQYGYFFIVVAFPGYDKSHVCRYRLESFGEKRIQLF